MTSRAFLLLALAAGCRAQAIPFDELYAQAGKPSGALAGLLPSAFKPEEMEKGTAVLGMGERFVWAVKAASQPTLFVDEQQRVALTQVPGSDYWVVTGTMRPGTSHSFHYTANGQRMGGRPDVAAWLPDSYEKPGVPKGTLHGKRVHASRLYDGMRSDYWVYVPAQVDAKVASPVMVWQDGQGLVARENSRAQITIDNLTHQKKIPPMVHVFLSPGDIEHAAGTKTHEYVSRFSGATKRTMKDSMRSTEYDTVSDRYARMLLEEVLPEVGQTWALRQDGYSRAICGNSSGGIAAFNAAWQKPEEFSRAMSRIGTFASIQWIPGELEGGHAFPFIVRKQPKRNIRVWLQDGSEDLENAHGSWPLQNIQMANSLKMRGYDYRFSWGTGSHSGAHGNAELPVALAWLWRGYDPAKTSEEFVMEAGEKEKPYYRVRGLNRE